MTILYVLLSIVYIISCIGNYKLVSREPTVVEAYKESPNLIFTILVICAIVWPVVDMINFTIAGLKK